ncbi:MAG: ABC transporter permease [Anaeromyxobacter sp.]
MHRILAIVERELRRFRRSKMLVFVTVLSPLLQLVVLGHAFGGTLHGLKVGLVDQDHGLPALKVRELAGAVAANARTFETLPYAEEGAALADLRDGKLSGVLTIPPGFSRRVHARETPRVALVENNADRFAAAALGGAVGAMLDGAVGPRLEPPAEPGAVRLDVVELFPFVPYIQYLMPGTICLAIFTMVSMGGAMSFIDDKTLGLHEGYLVTPITKLEMVAGFTLSGAVKAVISGIVLLAAALVIAGVARPLEPLRLAKLVVIIGVTAFAFVGMMFMLMARVENPMIPRIASMVLTTLLYFPSGAVYPTQAFPGWLRAIAALDPFTYAVDALRAVLLQGVGLGAVAGDLGLLLAIGAVTNGLAAVLLKRTL